MNKQQTSTGKAVGLIVGLAVLAVFFAIGAITGVPALIGVAVLVVGAVGWLVWEAVQKRRIARGEPPPVSAPPARATQP